jgi:transposase
MTLKPTELPPVPAETARVARAALPKGSVYLTWRDELGQLFTDEDFAAVFARRGQPGHSPAQLALVTVLQFMENLSDEAAANSVRTRIDWKYLLGLELTDPGFDASILSEFRARLLSGQPEALLLDRLLSVARERGWLKARGRQRTDSTHILAAVRDLNRLELAGETVRSALNRLAEAVPEWLRGWVPVEWFERYGRRVEYFRLPKGEEAQRTWVEQVGRDGVQLLQACYAAEAPAPVRRLPAVECLRRIWLQQFAWADDQLRWRTAKELPPGARLIQSPYDCEARYSAKRELEWVGYKTHVTETCDPDQPALITQVTTTLATQPDNQMLPTIQAALAAKALLPREHLVDAGYPSAELLVHSQQVHQVQVIGPMPPDTSWQAQAGQGYDVSVFAIDWEQQQATCPQGKPSVLWFPRTNELGHPVIHIRWAAADCRVCAVRPACTRAAGARCLQVRTRDQHLALQAARQWQTTPAFKQAYAQRAGIESTHSQALRRCDIRHTRYLGLAKTHLQQVISAVAVNLFRVLDWLVRPQPTARPATPFVALAPAT